jgi:hypothetical protein
MAAVELHVGVDFDNTIVCYDEVFHRLALDEALIPSSLPCDKTSVRDFLRAAGREDRWTAMQAIAYGERMPEARPFPGVQDFFTACAERSLRVSIISHRTRLPIVGEPCDLHAAAFRWLEANGLVDLVSHASIHFLETRAGKVVQVGEAGCTHFIDDLPEFLAEPLLPRALRRILFDPARVTRAKPELTVAASWAEIRTIFAV